MAGHAHGHAHGHEFGQQTWVSGYEMEMENKGKGQGHGSDMEKDRDKDDRYGSQNMKWIQKMKMTWTQVTDMDKDTNFRI